MIKLYEEKLMNMRKNLILVVLFLLPFISIQASENKPYEMPRTQVIPIQDSKSGGQYELYIQLPEEYLKDSDKTYPVIYFTDAIYHIAILSTSTENIMKDAILVGISWQKDIEEDVKQKYGAHASRFEDYSFWKNPNHPKLQFGQANNHLAFIRNDVFNYIEQNYRANPNDRSYFGYSLGGVFGAYILVTQPDTFKNYILGSPSVNLLTKHKIEFTNKKLNANIFISRGTLEDELREPISEFVTLLKARNDNSLSIESVVIEGGHETAFPMTGVRSVTWLSNLTKKSSPYTIAYSWNGINLTDNEGKSKNRISTNGGYAAWSPDGKRFAFYAKYDERKTWSIHTMNSDGTNRKRLTHVKNKWDNSPAWSPDGTKIAFSREYEDSEKNWKQEVWIMNSDGSQQTQIKPIKGGGPYFTPDGRIVFHSESKNKKTQISIADIDGNNIIQLTHNEAEEQHPEVSPNGKQIAFMSDRDGNNEIYVMNIDGSNQKRLTFSEAAKWYPSWSPDGSKIIFSSTNLDGERNIYMMNKDGSSVTKIISNGTQPAWSKIAN